MCGQYIQISLVISIWPYETVYQCIADKNEIMTIKDIKKEKVAQV